MKIEVKDEVPEPHFPRLMKSKTTGNIILILAKDYVGVVLYKNTTSPLMNIGDILSFLGENLVDFDGTVTLSN